MKVAIYSRTSTTDQNPVNQSMVLTDWAGQRGYDVVMVYEEQESAWKAGHQRELARLLEDARKRKFGAVLVWALDRLSREGPLAILSLVNRLKICGVGVYHTKRAGQRRLVSLESFCMPLPDGWPEWSLNAGQNGLRRVWRGLWHRGRDSGGLKVPRIKGRGREGFLIINI
jgi:hypothetical protein